VVVKPTIIKKPDAEQTGGSIREETIMDTIDKATNYAHETYDKIAEATSHVAETLGEKGDDLLYAEQKLMKQCRRYVRDYPITSLGIAATAGFLLSSLLRHR
jgi:ElaB/YqjD/DUF883 family membrane-anchored ribosome-binding protein